MPDKSSLLHEEPSLPAFTATQQGGAAINWYRSPLPPGAMKQLHERSDLLGAGQTLGFLAIYGGVAAATIWSSFHGPWWLVVACFFAFNMVSHFFINGVHELGHGTVFKTKGLNFFFDHLLAFLGWINHVAFEASHIRHHRYTLHPPDDLEVVLPIRLIIRHAFQHGIIDLRAPWHGLKYVARLACGRFEGEWELTLYPPGAPEKRRVPVRWARILLLGHAGIAVISACFGWWMVPLMFCVPSFCGSWLFFFCNNTQHVGLQDNVSDFRLCCRTFTLNPVLRFLYWQMNYHIEHHMYAAVPCYRLGRLHRLIRADLPSTPHGLVAVWKEIAAILARQEKEPGYRHQALVPAKCQMSEAL